MMAPRMIKIVTAIMIFHLRSFHHIRLRTWLAPRRKWVAVDCRSSLGGVCEYDTSSAITRNTHTSSLSLSRTCLATQVVKTFSTLHHLVNVVLHDVDNLIHLCLNSVGLSVTTGTTSRALVVGNVGIIGFRPSVLSMRKETMVVSMGKMA